MSEGKEDWFPIMTELCKVSDGGSALGLGIAAAETLASERVLQVLEPIFGLEVLCHNDASVGVDFQAAVKIIVERRRAVSGLRSRGLTQKRLRCLSMLDDLEKEMKASKERGDIK